MSAVGIGLLSQPSRVLSGWASRMGMAWCVAGAALLCGCDQDSMAEHRANTAALSAPPERIAVGPIPGEGNHIPGVINPLGDDAAVLQEGRRLFLAFNCYGCHGGYGGGGMGPSLRDEDWLYGRSDAQIFASIAAGRANGMPAWGTLLPESEIWKLVSYIQSMRTDSEPQKPGG
jgi:cytochrome c oxidase cbb3-type subunit III